MGLLFTALWPQREFRENRKVSVRVAVNLWNMGWNLTSLRNKSCLMGTPRHSSLTYDVAFPSPYSNFIRHDLCLRLVRFYPDNFP